jgi:hypothetical protein
MEERKDMKNQIVTVVTMMGEVVGRVKSEDDTSITLESPRLFVPGQDASGGGFAPGISMTGVQDTKEATLNKAVVLSMIETHKSVADGWVEVTSGIIV